MRLIAETRPATRQRRGPAARRFTETNAPVIPGRPSPRQPSRNRPPRWHTARGYAVCSPNRPEHGCHDHRPSGAVGLAARRRMPEAPATRVGPHGPPVPARGGPARLFLGVVKSDDSAFLGSRTSFWDAVRASTAWGVGRLHRLPGPRRGRAGAETRPGGGRRRRWPHRGRTLRA